VQDQQVDPVDADLARALLEPVRRLVVAVVADPDLRLQEDVRPIGARLGHGLADLPLVPVRRGGVDVPVAGRQRAASTAARVSSGGVWNTPRPSAGISTPLLRVTLIMGDSFFRSAVRSR